MTYVAVSANHRPRNHKYYLCIYRLDGTMKGLQDIRWAERTVARCMFWRFVIVPFNYFKPYDIAVTRFYSFEILTW